MAGLFIYFLWKAAASVASQSLGKTHNIYIVRFTISDFLTKPIDSGNAFVV